MTPQTLSDLYRAYIACLNRRDWAGLARHVDEEVTHNGRRLGVAGYRAMLEGDVRAIPDLRFDIHLLVCEPPHVAARLVFDCQPAGMLFGLPVDGRRVTFAENVIYAYRGELIHSVWSVIDAAAVAAQLQPRDGDATGGLLHR